MSTNHRKLTWTVMLLLLSGVCSQWNVHYEQKKICAFKGSSVVIPCSFDYPSSVKVQSVMWAHKRSHIYHGPFIYDSESNNNSPRYQYVGDKHHNCSLKIQHVEQDDTGKHAFRFTAASADGTVDGWTGTVGSRLEVSELKITMAKTNGNGTLKEGDSVRLTCSSKCSSGAASFTWLKNGQPVREGPVLHLSNISLSDSGNYSCSPNTQRRPTSEVINIDAEYGPKNTTASVRPSTEVDVGSNITLVCSSTANPPVEDYAWFKKADDGVIVGNGPELSIVDIHLHDGGQYLCRVINKHGHQNSSVVTIKVKAYWPTFTRDALIVAAVAMLIITILITTRRCFKRKVKAPQIIHETDCVEDPQDTVYSNLPVFANIQSESQYEEITTAMVYAAVDFNTKRKSNTQQQADNEENKDAGVIYSTVCRELTLTPSYMKQL